MASARLGSCKRAALGSARNVPDSSFLGQEMRRENVAGFPSLSISVRRRHFPLALVRDDRRQP